MGPVQHRLRVGHGLDRARVLRGRVFGLAQYDPLEYAATEGHEDRLAESQGQVAGSRVGEALACGLAAVHGHLDELRAYFRERLASGDLDCGGHVPVSVAARGAPLRSARAQLQRDVSDDALGGLGGSEPGGA